VLADWYGIGGVEGAPEGIARLNHLAHAGSWGDGDDVGCWSGEEEGEEEDQQEGVSQAEPIY
jgi:hypothetical protein